MGIVGKERSKHDQEMTKPKRFGVAYPCAISPDGRTDPKNNHNGPMFTGSEVPEGIFDDVSHESLD